MQRSEFLALLEELWDHSFSFLMPLIATILLIISEIISNIFMTSHLLRIFCNNQVCQKH